MNNLAAWGLSLLIGMFLGTIFFGGLWLTVGKAVHSKTPASWFLGSLILRMFLTVAGFYAVSIGGWNRLLACLLGFLVARQIVIVRTRSEPVPHPSGRETPHAP